MFLSSAERAAFATTARLLSCLVTESLVRAIFIPLPWSDPDGVGVGVVLNARISSIPALDCKDYSEKDILAVVALKHVPVFRHGSSDPRAGKEIGLLDPLDMFPLVFVTSGDSDSGENEEVELSNPLQVDLRSAISLCLAASR
jgi:hypothetical protein